MILQALVDYYERKRALNPAAVAPYGWEYREIAFFIDIANDGAAMLVDRRSTEKRRGELLLVPAAEIRSGNDAWKKPNLLWDHMGFVLGQQKRKPDGTLDPSDKPEKVAKQHSAFRARVARLVSTYPSSEGLKAIQRFYDTRSPMQLQPTELWEALFKDPGLNLTFRRRGHIDPICHEAWVDKECSIDSFAGAEGWTNPTGQCLLTGELTALARLHPKISYVSQKPSPLVAANTNEAPAYSSYGKVQALNAPVSVKAASRYALALNALLGRGSPNKVQIGDATTVIWADRDDGLEADLAAIFGDDPDAHVQAVKLRLTGALNGTLGHDDTGLHFFVLGLAPNASRIAVRFWLRETFARLGPRILQHFDDLRIVRQFESDPPTPPIRQLLTAIGVQSKADNVPARIAGEWMRSILEGVTYPHALLNAAVNRCRAEQSTKERAGNVTYLRAAILKGCINRDHRRRHAVSDDHQFIKEELDMDQTDPAYRLGRLFAVLESIQAAAQGSINASIRDRYYGAASSTPGAVFPTLLRLKNAHMKKLSNSREVFFEKLIGEICGSIERPAVCGFPRQLDIHAQGLFALGYYHQRQSIFTRSAAASENAPTEPQES
jgi:CRISPR-associated protein Csd1